MPRAPLPWRRLGASLLDTFFPPRCVGCGCFETFLCADCRAEMVELGPGGCLRCGRPLGKGEAAACPDCGDWEPAFTAVRSAFLHTGPARELVAGLKYGGQRALARVMAENAAAAFSALVEEVASPCVATWVPSHPRTERRRGYNQAELLTRRLVNLTGGPATMGGARKVRETPHQRELGRDLRRRNLEGAFSADLREGPPPGTRTVVVVDDVCTTGATAHEVASVLKLRTDLPVFVFTFSRAADVSVEGVRDGGVPGMVSYGVR